MWGCRSRKKRKLEKSQKLENKNGTWNVDKMSLLKAKIRGRISDLDQPATKRLKTLHANLTEAEAKLEKLKRIKNKFSIHEQCDLLSDIEVLKAQIKDANAKKGLVTFMKQMKPIVKFNSTIQEQSDRNTSNMILASKIEPLTTVRASYVESDRCTTCDKSMIFSSDDCVLFCPACGQSEFVLHTEVQMNPNQRFTSSYDRIPLYRKYLLQFSKNSPQIPKDVIDTILSEFRKIHLMHRSKVRPTPIQQILREKKLQRWTPYAIKICKIINQEELCTLSSTIIETLVDRFSMLVQAFEQVSSQRKKILNFEFLTRAFLMMEKRRDLAHHFSSHKTRAVLLEAQKRLDLCIAFIKNQKNDKFKWDID